MRGKGQICEDEGFGEGVCGKDVRMWACMRGEGKKVGMKACVWGCGAKRWG